MLNQFIEIANWMMVYWSCLQSQFQIVTVEEMTCDFIWQNPKKFQGCLHARYLLRQWNAQEGSPKNVAIFRSQNRILYVVLLLVTKQSQSNYRWYEDQVHARYHSYDEIFHYTQAGTNISLPRNTYFLAICMSCTLLSPGEVSLKASQVEKIPHVAMRWWSEIFEV